MEIQQIEADIKAGTVGAIAGLVSLKAGDRTQTHILLSNAAMADANKPLIKQTFYGLAKDNEGMGVLKRF